MKQDHDCLVSGLCHIAVLEHIISYFHESVESIAQYMYIIYQGLNYFAGVGACKDMIE